MMPSRVAVKSPWLSFVDQVDVVAVARPVDQRGQGLHHLATLFPSGSASSC